MTDLDRADSSDMESIEDEEGKITTLNPDILAALRNRFSHLPDIENFPEPIKRRIRALKQLQLVSINLESKFYEEIHALEAKYHQMNSACFDKRNKIITGVYEPNDEECEWDSDDEDEEDLPKELKEKAKLEEVKDEKNEVSVTLNEDAKGIPDFWLTIFKNVAMLAEMVQEHDEPILKHLQDIKIVFLEGETMGFILEFYFEANEHFTNTVLTKKYLMKCVPEKNDPFGFEGPEIYKSVGCTIDWKKGKNITVKTIKKNQKHKARGAVRTITKTVQNDSFFNFFTPPVVPEDTEVELDEDLQALLSSDFEIGHYIRERIVPRAVLYYTGEALEDEGEEFEEEEGDEDEEEEDDDDFEESEVAPTTKTAKGGKKPPAEAQECKQQ